MPYVSNVVAKQRYPWNGLVDISVKVVGTEDDCAALICTFCATNKMTKSELPIRSVCSVGGAVGAGDSWSRRYVWDATADVGYVKINEVELIVNASAGVQLWENGPYWAVCNVGAAKPEECGYYFWWGDTVGYKRNAANDGWVSVKDGAAYSFSGCATKGKTDSQLQSEGYIDSNGNLAGAHDAATIYLGSPWRMPTDAEFSALISNCDTTWTTCNGVPGYLITGRGEYASKSIFLPAAGYGLDARLYDPGSDGYYWSSTLQSDGSSHAWGFHFTSGNFGRNGLYRCYGRSVRPLRGFAK